MFRHVANLGFVRVKIVDREGLVFEAPSDPVVEASEKTLVEVVACLVVFGEPEPDVGRLPDVGIPTIDVDVMEGVGQVEPGFV